MDQPYVPKFVRHDDFPDIDPTTSSFIHALRGNWKLARLVIWDSRATSQLVWVRSYLSIAEATQVQRATFAQYDKATLEIVRVKDLFCIDLVRKEVPSDFQQVIEDHHFDFLAEHGLIHY